MRYKKARKRGQGPGAQAMTRWWYFHNLMGGRHHTEVQVSSEFRKKAALLTAHCCCSAAQLCPTLCNPMDHQAPLSFTISQSLLKLTSIESVMWSNHLVLCHPFPLLPSIFPIIRVFSNDNVFQSGSLLCKQAYNFTYFRSVSGSYFSLCNYYFITN